MAEEGKNDPQDQQNRYNENQNPGPHQNPPNRGDTEPSGKIENEEDVMRRYTLSISPEDRQKAFAYEDERWSTANQIKDWLKLGAMVVITAIWCLIVYFLVPGLR